MVGQKLNMAKVTFNIKNYKIEVKVEQKKEESKKEVEGKRRYNQKNYNKERNYKQAKEYNTNYNANYNNYYNRNYKYEEAREEGNTEEGADRVQYQQYRTRGRGGYNNYTYNNYNDNYNNSSQRARGSGNRGTRGGRGRTGRYTDYYSAALEEVKPSTTEIEEEAPENDFLGEDDDIPQNKHLESEEAPSNLYNNINELIDDERETKKNQHKSPQKSFQKSPQKSPVKIPEKTKSPLKSPTKDTVKTSEPQQITHQSQPQRYQQQKVQSDSTFGYEQPKRKFEVESHTSFNLTQDQKKEIGKNQPQQTISSSNQSGFSISKEQSTNTSTGKYQQQQGKATQPQIGGQQKPGKPQKENPPNISQEQFNQPMMMPMFYYPQGYDPNQMNSTMNPFFPGPMYYYMPQQGYPMPQQGSEDRKNYQYQMGQGQNMYSGTTNVFNLLTLKKEPQQQSMGGPNIYPMPMYYYGSQQPYGGQMGMNPMQMGGQESQQYGGYDMKNLKKYLSLYNNF
jgi:hypothetical protein